jgi:HEXXH motif-containing protein
MTLATEDALNDALAAAWLRPSGYSGLFKERVERARERTVAAARLIARDGSPDNDARAYVASQVAANPELLRIVPGQAGLSFSGDADHAGAEGVRLGMGILAAELAALSGDHREVVLPHRPNLLLPLSGLAVRIEAGEEIRLRTSGAGLSVTAGGLALQLPVSAGRQALTAPAGHGVTSRETIGGIRIDQHWDLLGAPVESFLEPTEIIPPELADGDRLIIRRAVQLLRLTCPELHEELVQLPVSFVPLAARRGVLRQSASLRQLPGVIYANLHDPFELLDLIVHEYSHLRLFFLEEDGPLMARPATPALAPWRNDRRTAQGLFHGIYVFHHVIRVLDRVFARWPASERGQARITLLSVCVAHGLRLLEAADVGLSPLAALLTDGMRADNEAGLLRLRQLDSGTVDWAEKVVTEHLEHAGAPGSDSGSPWFFS